MNCIYVNALSEATLPIQIIIYDMIGNEVHSIKSYQMTNQLELPTLAVGTYICRISDSNGKALSAVIEKTN